MASASERQRSVPSSAEAAVLGLLSLHDWSTYELAQQVRRSLRWFWPRAERAVYDVPKRLVAAGYATAAKERTGKRPRTVYGITEEGRAALLRWLREESAPSTQASEAELRLFFADAGTTRDLGAVIDAIEADAVRRLRAIRSMATGQALGETPYPRRLGLNVIGLRHQCNRQLETLRWARWARSQTAGWPAPDDTGEWSPRETLTEMLAEIEAELGPVETTGTPD
jgi:DNA-binding PadR family transcriptional regulator